MRIAVLEVRARREQRAGLAQVGADRPVGRVELVVDDAALAAEPQPVGPVDAVRIDREHRIDAVRLAQHEIVLAMIGRHMDEAGALVGGDEVAGQERARLGEEAAELVHRVAGDGAGEVGAFDMRFSHRRASDTRRQLDGALSLQRVSKCRLARRSKFQATSVGYPPCRPSNSRRRIQRPAHKRSPG